MAPYYAIGTGFNSEIHETEEYYSNKNTQS